MRTNAGRVSRDAQPKRITTYESPSAGSRGLKRWLPRAAKAVLALHFAALLFRAGAGTVITNNLPANTAIINIDARADGAATFNGDQSLWYHPFGPNNTVLQYSVQPGSYGFRVVNPADAAKLFPTLTTAQTNQTYTAWTYNAPWILDYLVFDGAAATNFSISQLFDGAPDVSFGNATDAYNASIAHGTYNQIRLGSRTSTNLTHSYTFTSSATLIFVVPDYGLGDNAGGVSVLVAPAPVLTLTPGAGTATLQWNTNVLGFTLASTTNLHNAVWNDVTNIPVVVGRNYSITVPRDVPMRFFRLHNP